MEEQEVIREGIPEKKPEKGRAKLIFTVVLTAVITAFITFSFCKSYFYIEPTVNTKLTELQNIVDRYYYGEPDPDNIEKSMLEGYVYGLNDKYSYYYDISDSDKRSEDLKGNTTGIGIIVVQHPETKNLYVKNVYDNAPANTAGLIPGDQIAAIDLKSVPELGFMEAVNSISREIGETVDLTVIRGDKTLTLTVTYSEFVSQTVFYKLLENGCGYVEITSFNGETPAQFKKAVNDLVLKGATSLIFDLRGNGGGTVDSVTEMVDFLCPEGTIMTAKYADGTIETVATSDASEIDLPMAVLTDETTASAAELFTASIREFGKGVSVGAKTYGKGVMQGTYYLSDGSSVVITIAEFFVHNDVSFNETGIEPQVPVTLTEEQRAYRHLRPLTEDPVFIAAAERLGEKYD